MKDIWESIKLLIGAMFHESGHLTELAKTRAGQYLRGLVDLVRLALILPPILAFIGIYEGWTTLTASAGILCILAGAFLAIWGIPIAVGIELARDASHAVANAVPPIVRNVLMAILNLKPRVEGEDIWVAVKVYVKYAHYSLFWLGFGYLAIAYLPLRNNWALAPVWMLAGLVRVIMPKTPLEVGEGGSKSWSHLRLLLTAVFGLLTFAFFDLKALTSGTGNFLKSAWLWLESGAYLHSYGLLALAILLGVGCLVWHFRKARPVGNTPATATAHTPASTHGSHDNHTSGGKSFWPRVFAIIGVVAVIGLIAAAARETGRKEATQTQVQSVDQSFRILANPGNSYTSVFIGRGTNVTFSTEGSGRIWWHFNNDPDAEDSSTQTLRLPAYIGERTLHVRSMETFPVAVRICLTPVGR